MAGKTLDTVTARELRLRWRLISNLVKNGKTILVTKDGKPLMKLSPPPRPEEGQVAWPDFVGRALQISGGKITQGNAILEERASHKW
jgi:antitoxin (DNA-binding transcriptional repressor) of toxin-antitoxin stability system